MEVLHIRAALCVSMLVASSPGVADVGWSEVAPLPTSRQEVYATTLDGLIYTGGGLAERASAVRGDFMSYDWRADTWQPLAPLPAARHHITFATAGEVIYAVGGFSGAFPNWRPEDTAWTYDPAGDVWSELPPLPVARGEHVMAAVNDQIYVIGGRVGGSPSAATFPEHRDTARVDIYDVATGTWSRGIDAPTARNSAASAVIDGRIYVVGGRQYLEQEDGSAANVNLATLEVFDPATGLWSVRAPMPQAAGGHGAAAFDGKLYVIGGEQWVPEKAVFAESWVYDPATDEWDSLPDLSIPRHGVAAAVIEGRLFAIGGATETGAGDVTAHEVLTIEP